MLIHTYIVILPPTALERLAMMHVDYPMLFKISNPSPTGKSTHCGVMEFSAPEGHCYIPYWVSSGYTFVV